MSALRIALTALLLLAVTSAGEAQRVQAPAQKQAQRGELFGEEISSPSDVIVYFAGSGKWDTAFETLVDAFKTVHAFLDREGVKPAGDAMMIYTAPTMPASSFRRRCRSSIRFDRAPQGDIAVGTLAGRAKPTSSCIAAPTMRWTTLTRRSPISSTRRGIDAKDLFIEEYVTDPRTTPEDKLVINVLVPVN